MPDELRTLLQKYLEKYKSRGKKFHYLGSQLIIRTQAPIQSDPRGRLKVKYGVETISLTLKRPGRQNLDLIRLTEEPYGEYWLISTIEQHFELINSHLGDLKKLVS